MTTPKFSGIRKKPKQVTVSD